MPADYVTGAEFSRWMVEESEFRGRLERRMSDNAQAVQHGLNKIDAHLAEINGRTRKNTEAIAVIEREIDAIETQERAIEEAVEAIKLGGCAQLSAHETLLQSGWTRQKKAAMAGGLVGAGALAWPAVQKIAEAVHAAIERWPQ